MNSKLLLINIVTVVTTTIYTNHLVKESKFL